MRRLAVAIFALLLATCVLAAEVAAAPPPPLFVFFSANSTAESDSAKAALDAYARRSGTVLLDISPPADGAPDTSRQLQRGVDAYNEFRYGIAVQILSDGLAEVSATGARGLSGNQLSDFFLYRGLAKHALGDATGSREDFVSAAIVDPTRRLDPVRFPPRAVESFHRAAAEVTAGQWSKVVVNVPADCAVLVDSRAATPGLEMSLAFGRHFFAATCPDHRPLYLEVEINLAEQGVEPTLVANVPPTLERIRLLAQARRAHRVLWLHASGEPTTIAIKLIDVESGRQIGSRLAPATGGGSVAVQFVGQLVETVDNVKVVTKVVTTPAPKPPWYKTPWFWGAVGVGVTAAILIPLAVDTGNSTTFSVDAGGGLPR